MKPNKKHVEKALMLIQTSGDYEFFLNNLNSPHWLKPLDEAGIFSTPEMVEETNDIITIPSWAPTKYLIKIASVAPTNVLEIILKVPETNNPKIHLDFIKAAIIMPSKISITLYDSIIAWLDNPYKFIEREVAILIAKYYSEGFDFQALELSKKLFEINYLTNDAKEKKRVMRVRNEWECNELLKIIIVNIINLESKFKFIILLSENLEKIIENEKINHNKDSDCSHVWRMNIEDTQKTYDNLENIFINWIRDIGVDIIVADNRFVDLLVNYFDSKSYPIFIRIAIYFVWKNLTRNDLVMKALMNSHYATDMDIFHEYSILLRDSFPKLDESSKNKILYFIDNLKSLKPEQNDEYKKYRLFYLTQDFMNNKWQEKLNIYKKQYGEKQEYPEYFFYLGDAIITHPKSTISLDELNRMTISEISNYLSTWIPPIDERYGEYTYGLSQEIEKVVFARADEFCSNTHLLKFNNFTFVRAMIQGFTQALTQNEKIDLDAVLLYLLWSVNVREYNKNTDFDKEMKLSGMKESACLFLQKALSTHENYLKLNQKNIIWKIIDASLNDIDPNQEREKTLSRDYYHIAINSTRGIALETAIRYGLWVMRISNIERENFGRENCPELFQVLDKHLDIQIENSKAVRSVYGVWLPWLTLLDSNWIRSNLNIIFPHNPSDRLFKIAAWEAYLLYSQPYDAIFREMETIYLTEINNIDCYETEDEIKIANRLVEHIIIFYLRSLISLDSEIFMELYKRSDSELRAHIINFMGRIMNASFGVKATEFWNWRIIACNKINSWEELKGFGWWLNVNSLPEEWLLDQAEFVLQKTCSIMPSHSVVETLVTLCPKFPEKVLKVFKLIVDNKVTEHGFFLWRSAAEALIPILINSPYKQETIDIINKLGAYGMDEFGKFLNSQS